MTIRSKVPEKIKEYCRNHQFELLDEYKDSRIKYRWKCSKGHEWKNAWMHQQMRKFCGQCELDSRFPKKEIGAFSNKTGITLGEYKGSMGDSVWKCKQGHTFTARWKHLQKKENCPRCYEEGKIPREDGRQPWAKSDAEEALKRKGYKVIEAGVIYKVLCTDGHLIEKPLGHLLKYRCYQCFGSPKADIEDLRSELKERGFNLVSDFKNAKNPFTIVCPEGHRTRTKISTFRRTKIGCKTCFYQSKSKNNTAEGLPDDLELIDGENL